MNGLRTLKTGCIASALVLLAACATTMEVGSDRYPRAEFGGWQTYAWIGEDPLIRPRGEAVQVSALTVRRIREAIEQELSTKGYRKIDQVSSANFVVAFTVGARDRIDAEAYPVPYRGPWTWSWRYADVQTYREGTLSIDIFDGTSRQPVWHGWARKIITATDTAEPGPVIQDAVARILAQFPSKDQIAR